MAFAAPVQAPEDPSPRFPHGYVHVSASDPSVLTLDDMRAHPPANVVLNWLHPLHEGSFGGPGLRIVYVAPGLFPVALVLTGLARWMARRRRTSRAVADTESA